MMMSIADIVEGKYIYNCKINLILNCETFVSRIARTLSLAAAILSFVPNTLTNGSALNT